MTIKISSYVLAEGSLCLQAINSREKRADRKGELRTQYQVVCINCEVAKLWNIMQLLKFIMRYYCTANTKKTNNTKF